MIEATAYESHQHDQRCPPNPDRTSREDNLPKPKYLPSDRGGNDGVDAHE